MAGGRADDRDSYPWQRPGAWLWIVIVLGFLLRAWLVVFTEGTTDVSIWEGHAAGAIQKGLVGYYHANEKMNHPPFVSSVLAHLGWAGHQMDIPFRICLRAPFALLDAGTALMLLVLFRASRWRFVIAAFYWLSPLTIIYSSYHGNTDSAMAFFLVLTVVLLSRQQVGWAGAVLGMSLWIKLPAVLALPAIVCWLPRWRARTTFAAVMGLVAVSTYVPVLLDDPGVVVRNVFGYRGEAPINIGGIGAWGVLLAIPDGARKHIVPLFEYAMQHNMWICLLPILLYSWMRRDHCKIDDLGRTIAGVYVIFYALTHYWAFQYFAWAIPFWFFIGWPFTVAVTLLAGGYVYLLYWLLCDSPWLIGCWNWNGHPDWPAHVLVLRNLSIAFFLISAVTVMTQAAIGEVKRRRAGV